MAPRRLPESLAGLARLVLRIFYQRVEVAGEADAHLLHPRVRMTVDEEMAGFWYNPYQGIVRARVPVLVSDKDATELYNRLNNASLTSLLEVEPRKKTEAGEAARALELAIGAR